MANEEHLKILMQGVDVWNDWREKNVDEDPDLSEADLKGMNLSSINLRRTNLTGANISDGNINHANLTEADLSETNLSGANLKNANLDKANFCNVFETLVFPGAITPFFQADLRSANLYKATIRKANLSYANLSGADLRGADLSRSNLYGVYLSGAFVDENTIANNIKGCQIGVNGIWSEITDSAALVKLIPPGNSMQGDNPDAIIESLKRARRLHGISMSLVGIILLIAVLGLKEIAFPYSKDITITPDRFGLLAMPMSIGILSLVNLFMVDALKGSRYLCDRKSAMIVGNFPWILSKYTGGNKLLKIQSFVSRFVMSFHPSVYIYFLGKWKVFNTQIFIFLSIFALFVGIWTFIISQKFQKPIIFDRKAEEERRDQLTKLSEAMEVQTKTIVEQNVSIENLIDFLKSMQKLK